MREQIKQAWHELMASKDRCGTYFFNLDKINGNRWAIVMAWMDYDNQDDWNIYAKVAYQPTNSIMQCDYDIDWMLPTSPSIWGDEVWDTETVLDSEASLDEEIDWLFKQWEEVKKGGTT